MLSRRPSSASATATGQSAPDPAVVNIYGDRVVNDLWKQRHPVCFMLANEEIADSYRQYFEYLWMRATP